MQRMTKRTRTTLFFTLALLFLAVTSALIFTALGYRLDWSGKRITQTGALYFKVIPSSALVIIDEGKKRRTDFFFGTLLIDDLLPGFHDIRVEKEGFAPWHKLLAIQERQVTEVKNIVLFPSQLSFKTLVDDVLNVWQSSAPNLFLVEQQLPQGRRLSLWNPKTNKETVLIARLSFVQQISGVLWNPEQKTFLVQFNGGTSLPMAFHEEGDRCTETTCVEDILHMKATQEEVLLAEVAEQLTQTLPGVKESVVSPDQKKIAFTNGSEIWILYLQDDEGQPKRTKGDLVFLNRFSSQAANLAWATSQHLLFSVGKEIRVMEIDDRDSANALVLGSFLASPSQDNPLLLLFWDDQEKVIYILNNSTLSVSEKLLR